MSPKLKAKKFGITVVNSEVVGSIASDTKSAN
jgi:glutamate formiminotransferase